MLNKVIAEGILTKKVSLEISKGVDRAKFVLTCLDNADLKPQYLFCEAFECNAIDLYRNGKRGTTISVVGRMKSSQIIVDEKVYPTNYIVVEELHIIANADTFNRDSQLSSEDIMNIYNPDNIARRYNKYKRYAKKSNNKPKEENAEEQMIENFKEVDK